MDSAVVTNTDRASPTAVVFRRFALALIGLVVLPLICLAAFVIAVDPYYVFGSPSWPGINMVRPFYEQNVLAAKPYQVRRIRPAAVALGSSRAEVGLDPRHPGWVDPRVFNFGLPASTTYEVMLAFLHAQAVGAPLRQAVVGLDFFAFNVHFARSQEQQQEGRFAGNGAQAFADFLATELVKRPRGDSAATQADRGRAMSASPARADGVVMPPDDRAINPARHRHPPLPPAAESPDPEAWSEAMYLAIHPDVAAAVGRGEFKSGHEHYLLAGRAEGRESGMAPSNWNEALYLKLHPDVAAEVRRGTFLSGYHHYLAAGRAEGRNDGAPPSDWNEAQYLAIYPDVAAEVQRGTFASGYHHYVVAGRAEGRKGGMVPRDWDEAGYLQVNPDVASRVKDGSFLSGYHHYLTYGWSERRLGGFQPPDWNEAGYLAANPSVRIEIAMGAFRTGYLHYAVVGRRQGLLGGFPPADTSERMRLSWPLLNKTLIYTNDMFRFVFSTTALRDSIATVLRQSAPASFDAAGVRLFREQDESLRRRGGVGNVIRVRLGGGGWGPWLTVPKLMYCFTNTDSGMTMFDPYRFMLRRAYAEGTDLRLFVSPVLSLNRTLLGGLGIGERYEFWLREVVRINEEEATLAGKQPFPLWDFSDANSITRDPVPQASDPTPMRWFWEHSHYRKGTGDLVLDRVFGYSDPTRPHPADFGVRLTGANVDGHIARTREKLHAWAAANSELVDPIVWAARNLKDRNHQSDATCW